MPRRRHAVPAGSDQFLSGQKRRRNPEHEYIAAGSVVRVVGRHYPEPGESGEHQAVHEQRGLSGVLEIGGQSNEVSDNNIKLFIALIESIQYSWMRRGYVL